MVAAVTDTGQASQLMLIPGKRLEARLSALKRSCFIWIMGPWSHVDAVPWTQRSQNHRMVWVGRDL